jgi:hypothetical protein
MFTNRCTYLLVLESTKIYIQIHTKMLLPNILTIVTLARLQYELPVDVHRPKHVGAF